MELGLGSENVIDIAIIIGNSDAQTKLRPPVNALSTSSELLIRWSVRFVSFVMYPAFFFPFIEIVVIFDCAEAGAAEQTIDFVEELIMTFVGENGLDAY